MLKIDQISSGYGSIPVLRNIQLTVGDDEVVAVLGPNGAGKTTLMKTIVGLARVHSGALHFDGWRLDGRRSDEIVRRGIALVPEGRHIFTTLTVKESLLLAAHARPNRIGESEDLDWVLQTFPALQQKLEDGGGTLSGGQQQMLALARAIMQRPKLILMDEPSQGLSPILVEQLVGMIAAVRQRTGAAVLIVEQDAGLALKVATRAYLLRGGRVVHDGSSDELRRSRLLLETYLGAAD